ncbi:hypothetical protein FLA_1903 [Filimonas lacunae]|nr:hypothetical protein FLA_1903 [Filimonas lacunae]
MPEGGIGADDTLNRTFNFVSANLLNFLPEIEADAHEQFFKDLLYHQKLSALDSNHPALVQALQLEGEFQQAMQLMQQGPCIICTFHMGSNRLLNHFLAYHQVPFAIVMANHIASGEGDGFQEMFAGVYQQQGGESLTLIEAQKPDAALKMLRELKKGKSLLVYIDGNTGAGDDSFRNENRCKIDFLGGSIYARSGVCYLAHLANVPVVTAVCYRQATNDIRLRFGSPVYPDIQQNRRAYATAATQAIYNFFTPLLKRYPEQWECWMYLHRNVDCNSMVAVDSAPQPGQPATGSFQLNKSRFGFFNIGEELYLFNKKTYTSYRVNHDIYQLLYTSFSKPVHSETVNTRVFEQLYANRVFVQAS